MDFQVKIVCILLLHVLQLCVPVQSVGCGTCTDGICDREVCYCNADFAGVPCTVVTCTDADPGRAACAANATCVGNLVTDCKECHADCLTNGGACHAVNTDPKCKCLPTKAGDHCQYTCATTCLADTEVCMESDGAAACLVDCSKTTPCGTGGTCTSGVCTCPPNKVGKFCQLECPTCGADEKCRDTPAGGSPECAAKCSGTPSCGGANGNCVDEVCSCIPNKAGDDCSLTCTGCQSTEICQETTDGTAECLVDCNIGGTPCAAGGTCTNGVCTCAANKAGKFCQLACNPVCAAGTTCKENAAGNAGECSGASALVATWIIFVVAAFSFM